MQMSLKEESFEIFDYSNYFIIPGIIDSNVSLSTSIDPGWQYVANITKMAASGGITTIKDYPELTRTDSKTGEIRKSRKESKGCRTSFWLIASIDPKTKEDTIFKKCFER